MAIRKFALMIGLASTVAGGLTVGSFVPQAQSAEGQPGTCPSGFRFTGEYRYEEYVGRRVRRAVCVHHPSWFPGRWERQPTVANVDGTCWSNWVCRSDGTGMYEAGSALMTTPLQRRTGRCQMTNNPRRCGRCTGEVVTPPTAACRTCRNPPACQDPNLGWRTREEMGCCT